MKKGLRIISLALSCIMIIGFVSLSYGADFEPVTGAAFGFQDSAGVKAGTSEIKAAAANPVGSSTDPFYVKPHSSSGTRYYLTNTGAVSQSSTTIGTFANMITELTYSLAYDLVAVCNRINALGSTYLSDIETNTNTLIGKLGNVESDVDDLRRYFDSTYYQLITSIDNKLTTIKNSAGLGPFKPYYMPDPSVYDYTADSWKKYIIRTANSTTTSTSNKENESFILQFKDYLNAQNLIEYWTYRRQYDYVVHDDYASETYNKWINVNTGAEYTAFKRSLWVDIRYINRFLSNLIYKTTGILSGTTFTLYDYNNTANTVTPNSLYDYIRMSNEYITQSIGRLAFVLANDEDIALRQQTQDQQNAFKTNFTESTANGRISGSDISDSAYAAGEIKSAFTSSASGRDAFNGFSAGTDGRWDWFSTTILNSLDTTTNNRKSNGDLTNFLGDYYNEVIRYAD